MRIINVRPYYRRRRGGRIKVRKHTRKPPYEWAEWNVVGRRVEIVGLPDAFHHPEEHEVVLDKIRKGTIKLSLVPRRSSK